MLICQTAIAVSKSEGFVLVDRIVRVLEIHQTNQWGSEETRLGPGSELSAVQHFVPESAPWER